MREGEDQAKGNKSDKNIHNANTSDDEYSHFRVTGNKLEIIETIRRKCQHE